MMEQSPFTPTTVPDEPAVNRAWKDSFAFELALCLEGSGEAIEDILERYNMTADDLLAVRKDKLFRKRLVELREDIRTNGTTFRMKARAQAEALLSTSWGLIHDAGVLPSVKADLIKSTVKWAGLEPQKDMDVGGVGGGGVTIHINLDGSDVPVKVQQKEPTTIEHEEE